MIPLNWEGSTMEAQKKITIVLIVVFLGVLYLFNMAYFSIKPDVFPVYRQSGMPAGTVFAKTAATLIEQELYGPGGWLPNDLFFTPGWFLDNKPHFQLGVLEAVRYNVRVLRDSLSRQRTTDAIDSDCEQAFTTLSNDPFSWIFPSAESRYAKGIEHLETYARRLRSGTAAFYPRSDNLIQLLEQYVSLLGGVNTRLLNASRTMVPMADNATGKAQKIPTFEKTPWHRIDDNFYYAQGVGYALYHLMQAVRCDFAPVLQDKNATVIVEEILASLAESYFEPLLVTNGGKDGILANHSNNIRVFLDDARQKLNSLITILAQG
ncbi:MAG: DUF2333 family protein [Desulfobacterota bacterium]|nr:DUF2333 family protein [Thermodesulfobacteriota bacterium]